MRIVLLAAMLCGAAAQAADNTISIPGAPAVRVHGPLPAARDLLAAEMAFEARSVAAGPAAAMRAYMDETDGLSFAGGEPTRGAEAIFKAYGGKGPGGKLSWVPSEVFVDKDAEMGATWGHFRFVPPVPNAPVVTGKYVTVWRKNPAGQWRGILDIGTPD
jgi:hypothetical protein